MEKVEVKFGKWLEEGFNLYKENIATLILAMVVALLLSVVTLGILAGPMYAGLLFITLGLYDRADPKPEPGSLFKGFDYFLNSFLFVIVWGVAITIASFILSFIPCIGSLASIFLVYCAMALLMFGPFLIVDKHMEFWPASLESFNRVKTNFWPFLGFSVVTGIIGSIGAVACGIGVVVTAPIQVCILTVAYREVFGRAGESVGNEGMPPREPDSTGDPA
ncbi:MAG: EI24 domain-containing protein [Deltaproteobacteria bacterium]|nr:EI24 domain-containing protein [Deltaproteobacteria bacterium]